MDRRAELSQALAPLWSLQPPEPGNIFQHPAFLAFKQFCQARFPAADKGFGISFALWDAVRALGLPVSLPPGSDALAGRLDDAIDPLLAAFDATSGTHRYLCPLDMADTLPEIAFGLARICRLSPASLAAAVDAGRLARHFPGQVPDLKKFAEFQWLIVEERVVLPRRVGERAFPFLYQKLGTDLGAIAPHEGKYPPAVTEALFALLLAPWEDWHSHGEVDWRGFQLPWAHLNNDDLFARPKPLPAPDTLTWEPAGFINDDGEEIEYERPLAIHLHDEANAQLRAIDQSFWDRLETARRSALFETPVEHFMVRAYFSSGMDEIIAHMTAIEAGLGLRSDFPAPGVPKKKGNGATKRLIDRVTNLLADPAAGVAYKTLFELRSAFLHGRTISGTVSSDLRNQARSLARRVAVSLIDAADAAPAPRSREGFLEALG